MNQHSKSKYEFPAALPLRAVKPGTNLLISGPSASGARELALTLALADGDGREGHLLISTDVGGRQLLRRCEETIDEFDRSRVAIVDAAGGADDQNRFAGHAIEIEDPGDLTALEIEFSMLYETLAERELAGVRIGVFSVSSLLVHARHRHVARFVHMLTGRVIATDDLGVFLVDSTAQDERATETMERFCDGSIEVRTDGDSYELRTDGLMGQPTEWTPFDL